MAFKNAVKILFNVFGLLWSMLLYVFICSVIVVSLGLVVLLPVLSAINQLDIGSNLSLFFSALAANPERFDELLPDFVAFIKQIIETINSPSVFIASYLFLVGIIGVLGRFLITLGDLPAIAVIDANMSSNASSKFLGKYISLLAKSLKFSLFSLLVSLPMDFAIGGIIYLVGQLFKVPVLGFTAPFFVALVFIILMSVKWSLLCCWSPEVISGEKGVIAALRSAVRLSGKRFASQFSGFVIAWTCILMINVFFALFTFGAGLFITIPLSMLFLAILRLTNYYAARGKRYYLSDEEIFNPPQSERAAAKEEEGE